MMKTPLVGIALSLVCNQGVESAIHETVGLTDLPVVGSSSSCPDYFDPTLTEFVGSTEDEFKGIPVDTDSYLDKHNGTLQIGSEVWCYDDEEDDMMYDAIILSKGENGEQEEAFVHFMDDSSRYWVPMNWCEEREPPVLWRSGPFLYTLRGDPHTSEFHQAMRKLSQEFPEAHTSYLSYWAEDVFIDKEGKGTVGESTIHPSVEMYIKNLREAGDTVTVSHQLPKEIMWEIDDKYMLYMNYRDSAMAASVFPETFGTVQQALKASEEDDTDSLFFVKDSLGSQGYGIRVLRRSELESEPEPDPGSVVIQRAVHDLLTVDDVSVDDLTYQRENETIGVLHRRRFDIRFFIVIHSGKVYLHSNMYAMWAGAEKLYDPEDPDIGNQVPKRHQYVPGKQYQMFRDFCFFPGVGSSWQQRRVNCDRGDQDGSPKKAPGVAASTFDPVGWREEVASSMEKAMPALVHVINATASDPTRYHLFGGDAIIERSSGRAILMEFNDFADLSFFNKGRKNCLENDVCTRRIIMPSTSARTGYTFTPPSSLFYNVTTGYTAQLLRDMGALAMGLEKPEDLFRFREIRPYDAHPAETCEPSSSLTSSELQFPLRCETETISADDMQTAPSFYSVMNHVDWLLVFGLASLLVLLKFLGLGADRKVQYWSNVLYLIAVVVYKWQLPTTQGLFSGVSLRSLVEQSFEAFATVHPLRSTSIALSHIATYWFSIAAWRAKTLRAMLLWWLLYEVVTVSVNEYFHDLEPDDNLRCMRSAFIRHVKQYAVDDTIRAYLLPIVFVYGYLLPKLILYWIPL